MKQVETMPPAVESAAPPAAARAATGGGPWAWLALCLCYGLVRLPFIFTVPMGEAPDEFAHYWVIKFIASHWRLPSAAEVAAGGPSAVYGSLPQLGYVAHVLAAALAPANVVPLAERFGSFAMGFVLLCAAYQIGKELFGAGSKPSLALPAVLVFHPQLAFLHAYANNDSTSSALSAVLLLLTLRSIRTGICLKRCLLIGLLAGWLALSKYSGLSIMPVVAFGLVAAAILNRTSIRRAILSALACAAVFAATCGWWFVRNMHEFAGDLLGTQTMYNSWALTFHKDLHYHLPASHIIKEMRWWRMMYYSFWGMFGYMNRYLWRPVYLTYVGFLIAAAVGWVLPLLRRSTAGTNQAAENVHALAGTARVTRAPLVSTTMWACTVLAVVINLAAMIWASTGNLGGPQGRYLFTSEVPVMALFLAGLYQIDRQKLRLVSAFLLFNAVTCIGSWVMLVRMYGVHVSPL